MLINKETLERVQEFQFKALFPLTSWPNPLTDAHLEGTDYAVLNYPDKPATTSLQQVVDVGTELVEGSYQVVWQVQSLPATFITQLLEDIANQIRAERDRRRFTGGVKVGELWFKSTEVATGEYNSMLLAIPAGTPDTTVIRAAWRTMSGVTQDMTPALAKQILYTGMGQAGAIDDACEAHIAALASHSDPANYDYLTGWPQSYEDTLVVPTE